jgi:stage II sporulation protein D
MFEDKPAHTFYHTVCGGLTENFENVFGGKVFPYLVSITDGSPAYCEAYSRFAWSDTIPVQAILTNLQNASLIAADSSCELRDILIESRFPSGRVSKLCITTAAGDTIKVFSNKIRGILTKNPGKLLRSTMFAINPLIEDDRVQSLIINGKGAGHGVGMCQWGAIYMAQQGFSAEEILQHYFPNTEIGEIDD